MHFWCHILFFAKLVGGHQEEMRPKSYQPEEQKDQW